MRESFVFYKSFYEATKDLQDDIKLEIYEAIFKYEFEDKEEITGIAKNLFALIKPQLMANNKRYENGKKGGAPKGNQNAAKQPKNNLNSTKNNQDLTKKQPKNNQKQPNVNVNVNVNDNVNDIYKDTKTTKFKKPTLEEIKLYCLERNNNVIPDKFFNYYESQGWKVGKNSMKDWKACIRTWEKNDYAASNKIQDNYNSMDFSQLYAN